MPKHISSGESNVNSRRSDFELLQARLRRIGVEQGESHPINCATRVVKAHAQMNDTCLVQSRGKATANKLKAGA